MVDYEALGIDEKRFRCIYDYLLRMLEVNKSINLTRITEVEQAVVLHIEDSLLALEDIKATEDATYADLGSGCGFPGVAIAVSTDMNTCLIDSSKKKMKAVGAILADMNLSHQIRTCDLRAEEVALEGQKYDYVTARAVSALPSVMELATPLLNERGKFIAYKTEKELDTVGDIQKLCDVLGLQQIASKSHLLSDGVTQRTILVFERTGEPSITLPRRIGVAQKRPLA